METIAMVELAMELASDGEFTVDRGSSTMYWKPV